VAPDGAAAEIGLKKGDVITRINDASISSWPELQGTIASYNAGDKVKITYKRDGKEYNATATLKNKVGSYDEVAKNDISERLGADLETLSKEKAKQYEVTGGVIVKSITKGTPIGKTRMEEGFVITSINGVEITSIEQLARVLGRLEGTVRLEGFYPGYEGNYTYPLSLED
jgi:serine protease Do